MSVLSCRFTHLQIFSRKMSSTPWDRVPNDLWRPIDLDLFPIAVLVAGGVSVAFVSAWNSYFPTPMEQLLWRIASVTHLILSLILGLYYIDGLLAFHWRAKRTEAQSQEGASGRGASQAEGVVRRGDEESMAPSPSRPRTEKLASLKMAARSFLRWMHKRRNVSPDRDPNLELSKENRIVMPIICVIYILCRTYLYLEDFMGLRSQPSGVYIDVNHFMPFL